MSLATLYTSVSSPSASSSSSLRRGGGAEREMVGGEWVGEVKPGEISGGTFVSWNGFEA